MAATVAIIIRGAIADALVFSGSNYMFSTMSKESIENNRRDMIKLWKICNKLK